MQTLMKRGLVCSGVLALLMTLAQTSSAQIRPFGADEWYYRIGGGDSFLGYRQSNRTTIQFGVGADWRLFRACQFDPRISITETFSDLQNQLRTAADDVLESARGGIQAWALSRIQESHPTLYDYVMNGVKDAQMRFNIAVKSCRDYQSDLAAGRDPMQEWINMGITSSWSQASRSGANPVAANESIEQEAASRGITWIDGQRRGGDNDPPIRVIQDVTLQGYQHIAAVGAGEDPREPVGDNALGAGLNNPNIVFRTAEEAQEWMVSVVGEREITTCEECDRMNARVGQGLRLQLVEERYRVVDDLIEALRAPNPTRAHLDQLSVPGMGLLVTDRMLRQLQNLELHKGDIFASKLASEIATMRVMEKALTARDILNAGMQEPNVAMNSRAQDDLKWAQRRLEEEINNMLFEAEVRKKIFSETALQLGSQSQEVRSVAPPSQPTDSTRIRAGGIRRDD